MGEYTVKEGKYAGLKVATDKVNPSLIQRIMLSVPMPKRPVYETRTATGRTETFPMDETSAKQTEGGMPRWSAYQEDTRNAKLEQNDKTVKALFMLGTDCTLPEDDDWEEEDLILGLAVPEHPKEKRAYFLMTHLEPADIIGLTAAVMRETGVSEEVIAEAEESFRDSVRDGSGGSGDMAGPA